VSIAAVSLVVTATMSATASVGYAPTPAWTRKWRDVLDGLAELEGLYSLPDTSNEPARRAVEVFFARCRELADWLQHNAAVDKADLYDLRSTDPALKICDGMAQTTKHHTRTRDRRNPDPITARVSWFHGGPGVHLDIDWSTASGASGTEDALDLARRCVSSWRAFFAAHGLDPDR
jgi:hypothetical protein